MEFLMKDNCDCESESYNSSVENGFHDEDRVLLRIGEKLKEFVEYDYEMIVNNRRQHFLPAKMTVIQILEDFVKHSAIKLVLFNSGNQSEHNPRRRVNSARIDRREKDFGKLTNVINIIKEVADGLRIYFDFTFFNHLIYAEEKEYISSFMQSDSWKRFTFTPKAELSTEFVLLNNEIEYIASDPCDKTQQQFISYTLDENQRRRLRSHKCDDDHRLADCVDNLNNVKSPRSGISITPTKGNNPPNLTSLFMKSLPSTNSNVPHHMKEYLQKILSWQILPAKAETEASMFFGAIHLVRLIVKLPEFLNASTISDEKLKILLPHLESFVGYLESHKECFQQEYVKEANSKKMNTNGIS